MMGAVKLPLRMLSASTCALLAAITAPACRAADGVRGTLGITTDYVHRGISQTDGHPVPQASVSYWHPTGAYASAWASRIRSTVPNTYPSRTRTSGEIDVVAGIGKPLGADWVIDLKGAGYWFPDDSAPLGYDYVEFSVGAAWRQRVYASFAYTPSTTWLGSGEAAHNRAATVTELGVQQRLGRWLTGAVGVGYHALDARGPSDYLYGSAVLSVEFRRLSLELGQYATDSRGRRHFGDRAAGQRTVLTATVNF